MGLFTEREPDNDEFFFIKVIKRKHVSPTKTMNIWLIPTMCYLLQKMLGIIIPSKEWYWWVGILIAVSIWLGINFKIVKNK
jgi:hypothetical protein